MGNKKNAWLKFDDAKKQEIFHKNHTICLIPDFSQISVNFLVLFCCLANANISYRESPLMNLSNFLDLFYSSRVLKIKLVKHFTHFHGYPGKCSPSDCFFYNSLAAPPFFPI